MTYCNL